MNNSPLKSPPANSTAGDAEEIFYTYEQAARMTAISISLVHRFVSLNLLEPQEDRLRPQDLARIAQILRLRRDLGVNWVGAGMMLDLCREIAQLKARLNACEDRKSRTETVIEG